MSKRNETSDQLCPTLQEGKLSGRWIELLSVLAHKARGKATLIPAQSSSRAQSSSPPCTTIHGPTVWAWGGGLVSAKGRLGIYNITRGSYRIINLKTSLYIWWNIELTHPWCLGRPRPNDSWALYGPRAGHSHPWSR